MIFDHLGFNVSDFAATKSFLVQALAPLGIAVTSEGEGWATVGRPGEGMLWFGAFGPSAGALHLAFAAADREQVRRFHAAALAAGGRDNGAPGLRPHYHPNYYGACVIGPDGHNFEAVCHAPEGAAAPD
jgi:catechol 2,3-dioxygenase-like lactoylglutathione lyase family enzyme